MVGGLSGQPERLEERRLLAFDLVAAYAASTTPFYARGVTGESVILDQAPGQITLRFTPGVVIDPATLGGITIVRAGGDGEFGTANDVPLLPLGAIGYVGVDDVPNQNQVVIRFAESLPDDTYQIFVGAELRSLTGEAVRGKTVELRLDLGAQVTAVVPQPISRSGTGQLAQARNRIDVYFNVNDPLDQASAETVGFYRLIEVDSAGDDIGNPLSPAFVNYTAATGTASLVFADNLPDGTLYRLEIGGSRAADVRQEVAEALGNNSSFAGAQALGPLSRAGISVTGDIVSRPSVPTPAGPLLQPSPLGSRDEPGHRDHPFIDSFAHGLQFTAVAPATPMTTLPYNFQDEIGFDPQGNVLYNVITEAQKQRAREILELFSLYTGVQFVETANLGLTIATGDLRALDPSVTPNVAGLGGWPVAYMTSSIDWGESEYGGGWFNVAMHEIGHALGLAHSYDLPSVMGGSSRTGLENVFPRDYDIGHLRQLYPIHGADIDLYQFTLPESGTVALQTMVSRPGMTATSPLDTVLTLYRQDPFTGRRELIARNDDSFGRDSFLELDLAAEASGGSDDETRPYVYFVAVSSTGNTAFHPEVADSGFGGRTEGEYELRIDFTPESWLATTVVDVTGTPIDGDRDGTPGGLFRFWFQTAEATDTFFVDKANPSSGGGNGSLEDPFTTVSAAIAAAEANGGTRIIRIVGNTAGPGGQPLPYLFGTDFLGQPLPDGETFNVPAGVTVMIDAGAVFKLDSVVIDVGSSSELVSRAGAALQVLGTPGNNVIFTSYADDAVGGDSDGQGGPAAAGQWGGIVLRHDSDHGSKRAFVNSIGQATLLYGGGQVVVDAALRSFAPIQAESSRPAIVFNTVRHSAGAALAATPNSFLETSDRIGPEIRGNVLADNSVNGLFVKIDTQFGIPLERLDVPARFKSTDVVYVIAENLVIDGGVGGYVLDGTDFVARATGRLTIDPGVVVKLQGSRIELERGKGRLYAEGLPNQQVIFTSLHDNRFGAGGTFATGGDFTARPRAGDWGGIVLNAAVAASIDHAYIGFGGGRTPIEGTFDNFNVIEVHQAELRLAHTRLEHNASGLAISDRTARGRNAAATVFVRGAQPIIVGNDFRENDGAVVSINANSLTDAHRPDPGRATGFVQRVTAYDDNLGPLVGGNLITAPPQRSEASEFRIDLQFGPGLTSEIIAATEAAARRWETIIVGDLSPVLDPTWGLIDDVLITVQAGLLGDDDSDGPGGVLANAGPRAFRSANDVNPFLPYLGAIGVDMADAGSAQLTTIMIHEIGHALGLPGVATILGLIEGSRYLGENALREYRVLNPAAEFVPMDQGGGHWNELVFGFEVMTPFLNGGLNPLSRITVGAFEDLGYTVDYAAADPYGLPADGFVPFQTILGMEIRGEEITVESVWDDTDIVHVLRGEIVVENFHSETGLRLLSKPDASLVVKLEGSNAGFTAAGYPLDIDYRIGGTVQIVGQPLHPVVLASLHDDSVGAGLDPLGRLVTDTNANGASTLPRPGDWRSLQFQPYSNDRNVAIITESERPLTGGTDTNGRIATAQPLGVLAPNFATGINSWESAQEKSGDEYRRLGFEVHGFIAPDDPTDVDVYSFLGYAGSEVWIDIDKTSSSLDAMVEVLNAAGVVIARSVDGQTDLNLLAATLGQALPLEKDFWRGGDHYTLNPKDPGMRLILPGTVGQQNQYFVRVRSQPRYDATTAPAEFEAAVAATNPLAPGATSGRYELRIRLRQLDEKPGSTVQFADIRHAAIGIDVQGLPRNSLLLGEIGENQTDDNGSFASAQYVGNLLQSDRGTLSIAGEIANAADVDWYSFALNVEQIQAIAGRNDTGFMWATVFDLDYGAGFRGDLTLAVFDSDGRLIYVGRDSNIEDDQPGFGQGTDFDDIGRGSISPLDPYIGTVNLLAGGPTRGDATREQRYFVAVFSNEQLPDVLNATFQSGSDNTLVRLEPITSIDRIVEDRIGSGPAQIIDTTDQITLQAHVTPFTLSNVTLFVASGSSLVTVDAMRGGIETTIEANYGVGSTIGDMVMRSDGELFMYRGITGNTTTAGQLTRVNSGTGAVTVVGNDNVADPVTTTQNNLAPSNAGTVATTDFQLAAQNLQVALITGSVRFTRVIPADPGPPPVPAVTLTGTWTFTANPAAINGIATLQIDPGVVAQGLDNAPLIGTVNLETGVVSITWQNNVLTTDVLLPTITYSSTFNDIATDQVDAAAWRRAGVGDYPDLVYSVWDPGNGRSVLYLANPANGSAAFVQDQRWGLQGVLDNVGRTTGMAYVDSTLYGVDEDGKLFTIAGLTPAGGTNNFTVTTTVRATIVDDFGDPINFQGLTIGPQNLEGGLYAELLFGIDNDGLLYCFDIDGNLQTVFDSNADGTPDATSIASGVAAPRGLAFSPLDINLWHPTTRRGTEAGHGINLAPDNTRRAVEGGLSFYFGFEQYVANFGNAPYRGYTAPGVNGQYGVDSATWQQDLSSNPAIGNNYNLPGGAYGSLTTDAFDLTGYVYTDKPTLYFNYWLGAENAGNGPDTARVWISSDGGLTWEIVATSVTGDLPSHPSVSSRISTAANQHVQRLFGTANWRQARIDIGEWAGEADLRLRFEFTTGAVNDPARGQNNQFEGFYIDDIIVGFAERGEMVTAAPAGQTGFFDIGTPTADPFAQQILAGPYQLEIRRGTVYVDSDFSIAQTFDTNDRLVPELGLSVLGEYLRGDRNALREQGQFIIQGNTISDAAQYGVRIDAGARDPRTNAPIPGVPRNLPVLNNARLAPGAVVSNNVIVGSGTAGILFSGDPNTGNVPPAAVPFGRIVNNTIYGGDERRGIGIEVTQNAGPTLLNNLFANLDTAVRVDSSSRFDRAGNQQTVVGGSAYFNTPNQVVGVNQSFPLVLTGNPFVNAAARNFYPVQGSPAIDSAVNSLQDRNEFRVVAAEIGIGPLPILAPDRDRFGQLRGDDPSRPSATGLGSNVFKDRGAIDRIDFAEPRMTLLEPLDQRRAGGSIDQDRALNAVRLEGADAVGVSRFVLQLSDSGTGIDPATVVPEAVTVLHEGVELVAGRDFTFRYVPGSNQLILEAASVYRFGEYTIIIGKRAATEFQAGQFTDRANNPLARNKTDGSTSFRIVLVDAPGAPTMLVGLPGNGSVQLSWAAAPSPVSEPILGYVVQHRRPGTAWTTRRGVVGGLTTTITGLNNGLEYYFRVAAVTASGRGPFSVPTGPIVPGLVSLPGVPQSLTADAVASGTMQLSWNSPAANGGSAITDYLIEYREDPAGSEWQQVARLPDPSTTAIVTGLTNGQRYRFRVRAVNIEGAGEWSNEAVELLQAAPAAPTQPLVAGGDSQVTLSWTPPDDGGGPITEYVIAYRVEGSDWSTAKSISVPPGQFFGALVTGLVNGTAYRFRVAARNAIGVSPFSVQSIPVVPGGPAAAPSQLQALAGDGQVALSWTAPTDTGGRPITDYLIQFSIDGGTTWDRYNDPTTDTAAAVLVGLVNGQSYQFRVAAVTSIGTGRYSEPTSPLTPVPMPMGLTGSPGDRRVTLSWLAPSVPVTGYLVQYRIDAVGSAWTTFPTGTSTATSVAVTGLTNGTGYRFRVAGLTAPDGQTAYSHESAPVTPEAIASAPSNVLVSAGDQAVAVSWTAPADTGGQPITNYRVEYRETGSTTWVRVDKPVSPDTYTIARNLTNGREYEFRVAAVTTELGEFSAISGRVVPQGPPPSTAPAGVSGSGFGGVITVNWQAVVGALEYIVEYRRDSAGSEWERAPLVPGTLTSLSVGPLFDRLGYRFRVGIRRADGVIVWSQESANIRPR